jgi:hypothetical protein
VLHKQNDPGYFPVKNYGEDNVTSSFLVVALLCVATILVIRNGHIKIRETREAMHV